MRCREQYLCACCEQIYDQDNFIICQSICHDCLSGVYEEYTILFWYEEKSQSFRDSLMKNLFKYREKYRKTQESFMFWHKGLAGSMDFDWFQVKKEKKNEFDYQSC